MTAERYVLTKAAREAVEGHEIDILKAAGIDWSEGRRTHIDCPFPGHQGTHDWRWDKRQRKGFCTCRKGFSIFDAVMEVEGLDIDAAKIRCVEIVGRTDLIREKREGGGGHQRSDARSLLDTPADRRDDTLPAAYFGHRLGVESSTVLMPSTPVVGIAALAYFDPPKGKGTGKPVHVGDYPCVVLGQIDAEGRQHAHRIYVAAGGAGKAALGRRDDGQERDSKKSAKRPEDGGSTAGRVVVWGQPKTAAWGIIAEGAETAAAVAHAFRDQVETGVVYVVAGINAGGIEAFVPWPTTKRVTVAADRDEAAKPSRPEPTRRGERAARTFGIRNRDRVAAAIALPGSPGTATDWLDIHMAEGAEAVRGGILAAVAYEPTAAEIAEERERREGVAELERVQRDYPLPELDTFTLNYQRTLRGQIRVHQYIKVGDSMEAQPIATPFGVIARLRMADDDDAYGLRLVVEDMGGKRRAIDVDRATFAKQAAAETRAMLFSAGLRTEGDGEHIVVKCLKAADPANETAVVKRPGFHELPGIPGRFFVAPGGEVIGADKNSAPELSVNSRIAPAIARGGTLEGWKDAVAAGCLAPRCEHWAIGAMAGFAGVVTSLCGLDTCGISLSGMTSGGKTTAQRLAVSAWSRAALDQRDSLLQTARATANGVEAMAARSNGTVLAMDELGHVTGKELGRIIYSLASGVGKARMASDTRFRASLTWSTFIVLSAEKSLEEKVRGEGGEWFGGMAVRIADIDITGVDRAVDRAVLDRIRTVDQHFGHAGPAFVEALVANGLHEQAQQIREGINRQAASLAGHGADGKVIRAAMPFAILSTAGHLACRFGLLPQQLDVGRVARWAWEKFSASTDAVALDPETLAVNNLRAWIAERWGSEIQPVDPEDGARQSHRNATGWFDDSAIYLPAHRIVEAAGGALKEIEIGRALDAQALLAKKKDKDRFYYGFVPKVGPLKVYALRRSEFRSSARDEPAFKVHEGGRL